MNSKQTFSFDASFLSGYSLIFIKLVLVIIGVYLIVITINFLRDKFINKAADEKQEDIADLLLILNKLFFISGFGFIIANILQVILSSIRGGNRVNLGGEWGHLVFGIIIIFVGIGLKAGHKILKRNT